MPELPEVETVRRGLEPAMVGHRILHADIRRPDLRWPFPPDMAARLTDKTVERLRRRSKYILADLSSGETLIIHLGMSGRMQISGKTTGEFAQSNAVLEKHDHVVFDMDNGKRITFNDARRFGAMDIVATKHADQHRFLSTLGPEPLGNSFDGTYLRSALAGRRTPIKSALLDQKIVAGLGNIYVCEILHRTRISPEKKAADLGADQISSLIPVIREVLREAIEAGGSSLKDYRQTGGELGYFQHRFKAYDRDGETCKNQGCKGVIQRIVQSGRSTFYCPQCQR